MAAVGRGELRRGGAGMARGVGLGNVSTGVGKLWCGTAWQGLAGNAGEVRHGMSARG
jgi:hypothetical protein